MTELEIDARYLCRDGHVRRIGRDWSDGTITWVLEPIPAVLRGRAKAAVGTCTRETFAALRFAMAHERLGEA